jgi:Effector-associated domain 1/Trypsin-like peptidase domain
MPLTGGQRQALREGLINAFDQDTLAIMLSDKLDKRLDVLVKSADFQVQVFQLIQRAEQEGWTYKLVLAARESRPDKEDIVAFAQQLGVAPLGLPKGPELEAMIVQTNAALDIAQWRTRLGQIEGQVCRVEIAGQAAGTGFLLGKEVVMTNYHVVEPVIKKKAELGPADIVLRFDYKRLEDGVELSKGKEYRLVTAADAWLLDQSPYSTMDLKMDPKPGLPGAEELDYALLLVDGSPGDEAMGEKTYSMAPARRWLQAPGQAYGFEPGTPLFIVQHPEGAPLKLALDTNAVIGINGNGTRVRYRTNTEKGSSGSPVFDQNWNLVALHHSGDPKSLLPTYNEGIPFKLIVDRLGQKGLSKYLG